MQTVIVLIHLMVVVAMIGVIMLQRSEGGGLGIGSTGGFMSSRGTANVLTRATAVLAATFFVTSLALSILAGLAHRPTSIIQTETPSGAPGAPGAPARSVRAGECSMRCARAASSSKRRQRRQRQPGRKCRDRSEGSRGPRREAVRALQETKVTT